MALHLPRFLNQHDSNGKMDEAMDLDLETGKRRETI